MRLGEPHAIPVALKGKIMNVSTTPTTTDWRCDCSDPGTLFGHHEPSGLVQIIGRDGNTYTVSSPVHTECPRCRRHHILDLRTLVTP